MPFFLYLSAHTQHPSDHVILIIQVVRDAVDEKVVALQKNCDSHYPLSNLEDYNIRDGCVIKDIAAVALVVFLYGIKPHYIVTYKYVHIL